jgi:hypothetical protein
LSYEDGRGKLLKDAQSLSLVVQARPVHNPQLVVIAYHIAPEFVAPGDPLTLTIEIANVGSADAKEVLLALGGQDGAALEPFLTVDNSNVVFLGTLVQGGTAQVALRMLVDGGAQAKAYNLPVAISYTGAESTPTTKVQRIGMIVRQRVELQVDVYSRPESMAVETPGQISLEVRNVGRGVVDVIGLQATAVNARLDMEDGPFAGPLDAGGSASLDLVVTPTRWGTVQLGVHVSYRDEMNRVQTWRHALSLEVERDQPTAAAPPAAERAEQSRSEGFWKAALQVLRGFVGFGS